MKKISVVIFSLIFLYFFAYGKGSETIRPGETIKIGFLGPMTGDAGDYGRLMSQSVRIAVEEFNMDGGAEGYKAELIVEDDEGLVRKATLAADKLVNVDNVFGIVGGVFSSVSLAIAPKAEAAKVIMISPSSTDKALPDKGDFIFRTIMSDALQPIVFAKYLTSVEKIKTAAILYVKNDYCQELAMDFKTHFEKNGGKVVAIETAFHNDKDFEAQLTKIKGTNPEALYLPNYTEEIALILKQAKQLGLKTKICGADGFSNPQILQLARGLEDGALFTNLEEPPASPIRNDFKVKYQAKWGEKPDIFSLNAYDGAKLILKAIKTVSIKDSNGFLKIDRDKVRDVIARTKEYDGVSGKITFTSNGDIVANIGVYTIENGRYKPLKIYKANGERIVEIK